ncbi:MAG: PilZ domain-containing protein [Gammaproteobacteria bacterium]|nr:PilZ domain-containing protein [Gammaproteobacteria bacterium]MCP5410046.1 PilZ domain-containing protein [Chromatiaceae bacterium]MCP5443835.1 PilZ domain-containing protein [Chromatiaceae bacterium]
MHIRQFERHPTDIPFKFKLDSMIGEHEHILKDISQGGLRFRAHGGISPGTSMCICIPFAKDPCRLNGKIAWCRKAEQGQYEMGIKFERYMEASALQQIDQIEIYKRSYGQACGHRLTSEDAGRRIGAIG